MYIACFKYPLFLTGSMAPFIFVHTFHVIIEDSKLLTFMGNETGIGDEWGRWREGEGKWETLCTIYTYSYCTCHLLYLLSCWYSKFPMVKFMLYLYIYICEYRLHMQETQGGLRTRRSRGQLILFHVLELWQLGTFMQTHFHPNNCLPGSR